MSLTTFREAVQDGLATALAITFVPGKLEGPIESRDLGCAWTARVNEVSGFVSDETVEVRVRVFKRYQAPVEPEKPFDPATLEALVESVQTWALANQTGLGPWFQRFVGAELDPDTQGVEVVFIAWQDNPAE